MYSGVLTTVLTTLGVVGTGWLTYAGVRLTQRQTATAAKGTREIEQAKVDAAAYAEATKIWDELIKDLREQIADQRSETSELRKTVGNYHSDIVALRARVDELEQRSVIDRRALARVITYARDLLGVLRAHNITPPKPPEGMDLESP